MRTKQLTKKQKKKKAEILMKEVGKILCKAPTKQSIRKKKRQIQKRRREVVSNRGTSIFRR